MKLALRPAALAFALAVVLALGGCDSQSDRGLSSATRAQLAPLIQQVRRAAESRDLQGAQRALVELQHAVASYRDRGNIGPAKAAQILDAATQVQLRLALVPTSTTTTTTTTAPPREHGHGNKNKHGKGIDGNAGGGND